MAKVLPPAPAQKSTTISPRLASSSKAKSCEPSSCTSTSPCTKAGTLAKDGLPLSRMPHGEYGVAWASKPAAWSSSKTASRFFFWVLMRKSSGAGWFRLLTKASKPSPTWAWSD